MITFSEQIDRDGNVYGGLVAVMLHDETTDKEIPAVVDVTPFGILVKSPSAAVNHEGVGECLLVQFYDGKLVVNVWSDEESEDPTHQIEIPLKD